MKESERDNLYMIIGILTGVIGIMAYDKYPAFQDFINNPWKSIPSYLFLLWIVGVLERERQRKLYDESRREYEREHEMDDDEEEEMDDDEEEEMEEDED